MFESLADYFYSKPGRITVHGKVLVLVAAFLLLVSAIGQVATRATNILPTLAQQPETNKTLADIYPTLPVWWIPESLAGGAFCLIIMALGFYTFLHGKAVDRFLKSV
jgi:hypothetical protein